MAGPAAVAQCWGDEHHGSQKQVTILSPFRVSSGKGKKDWYFKEIGMVIGALRRCTVRSYSYSGTIDGVERNSTVKVSAKTMV